MSNVKVTNQNVMVKFQINFVSGYGTNAIGVPNYKHL